jgi:hypothetical protein
MERFGPRATLRRGQAGQGPLQRAVRQGRCVLIFDHGAADRFQRRKPGPAVVAHRHMGGRDEAKRLGQSAGGVAKKKGI